MSWDSWDKSLKPAPRMARTLSQLPKNELGQTFLRIAQTRAPYGSNPVPTPKTTSWDKLGQTPEIPKKN
jgi:hypothetical protein